jgi:hypothetical protein
VEDCPLKKSVAILWLLLAIPPAAAQSPWEVTPYRCRVWTVLADSPRIPAGWRRELPARLEARLRSLFGATWQGTVEEPPAACSSLIRRDWEHVSARQLLVRAPALDRDDKLMLVVLEASPGSYHLRTRQLDCRTQLWTATSTRDIPLALSLVEDVAEALVHGFAPLVEIDRVHDERAEVRVRAGALIVSDDSPARLREGAVLQPVTRRNDQLGRPLTEGIQPVPWTYFIVGPPAGDRPVCQIVSGFRQPLGTRRSRRVERLALLVRPTADQSTIVLQSRDDEIPRPLVGYDIYIQDALEDAAGSPVFLARTDWRGHVTVPARDDRPRLLYVRHGDRFLARLPVLPGVQPRFVAALRDDRQRVAVEGFLQGVKANLIDLVARRQSLSQRIRRSIEQGDLDQAERHLERFRALPSRDDLRRQIELRRQTMDVADDQLRRKIDTLFADMARILGQYLDPNQARQLEGELRAARSANRPPPPAAASRRNALPTRRS